MSIRYKNQSFLRRLSFAISGIRHALANERSLATQCLVLSVVLLSLLALRPKALWCALLLVTSGAVIAAELFNTAIERLADHLHPNEHQEIRMVKDYAAGAVLVISICAAIVGLLFAVDYFRT